MGHSAIIILRKGEFAACIFGYLHHNGVRIHRVGIHASASNAFWCMVLGIVATSGINIGGKQLILERKIS